MGSRVGPQAGCVIIRVRTPVDPDGLGARLEAAGFAGAKVRRGPNNFPFRPVNA